MHPDTHLYNQRQDHNNIVKRKRLLERVPTPSP